MGVTALGQKLGVITVREWPLPALKTLLFPLGPLSQDHLVPEAHPPTKPKQPGLGIGYGDEAGSGPGMGGALSGGDIPERCG